MLGSRRAHLTLHQPLSRHHLCQLPQHLIVRHLYIPCANAVLQSARTCWREPSYWWRLQGEGRVSYIVLMRKLSQGLGQPPEICQIDCPTHHTLPRCPAPLLCPCQHLHPVLLLLHPCDLGNNKVLPLFLAGSRPQAAWITPSEALPPLFGLCPPLPSDAVEIKLWQNTQ